jgi:hypothetical protein
MVTMATTSAYPTATTPYEQTETLSYQMYVSYAVSGTTSFVMGTVPAGKKWKIYGIYINNIILGTGGGGSLGRVQLECDNTGAGDIQGELQCVCLSTGVANAVITIPIPGYIVVAENKQVALKHVHVGSASYGAVVEIWYVEVDA